MSVKAHFAEPLRLAKPAIVVWRIPQRLRPARYSSSREGAQLLAETLIEQISMGFTGA